MVREQIRLTKELVRPYCASLFGGHHLPQRHCHVRDDCQTPHLLRLHGLRDPAARHEVLQGSAGGLKMPASSRAAESPSDHRELSLRRSISSINTLQLCCLLRRAVPGGRQQCKMMPHAAQAVRDVVTSRSIRTPTPSPRGTQMASDDDFLRPQHPTGADRSPGLHQDAQGDGYTGGICYGSLICLSVAERCWLQ